jgi:3,5-epimerase/4-reductase
MYTLILGKGFVGTHLAHHFRVNNIEHKIFSQKELDYTNAHIFKEYVKENNKDIQCVINCSGYTGVPNVDACEDNKELCYNYNVIHPLQVIKICDSLNIPVIHVGSGCIYSGYGKQYTENDTPDFGIFSNESSFYSKCKHIFETFALFHRCYIFRIRIPFTGDLSSKNYFSKLYKYDNLINELNSITSITDFNEFVVKFMQQKPQWGVYNVVNPQPLKADEVVRMMRDAGIDNPKWNFIALKDLNTKAKRSNCVLSSELIKSMGLELPDTRESLKRDIALFAEFLKEDTK